MKTRAIDSRSLTTFGILILIALAFYLAVYLKTVFTGSGSNPHLFFHPDNVANLLGQAALVGILACGMTLVIVSGHIDLSVGSMLGMLGAIAAFLMSDQIGPGFNPAVAALVAIGVGIVLGSLQGAIVAWIHVPAFVVTLGGLMAYRGVLLIVAKSTIPIDSVLVNSLGAGVLRPSLAYFLVSILLVVYGWILYASRRAMKSKQIDPGPAVSFLAPWIIMALVSLGTVTWLTRSTGVPLRFLVMIVLAISVHFLATRFRFGRHVYAIGGNREAALYSGIHVEWHLVGVFALMGGIAGLAGLVSSGIQMAADAGAGDLMELYAIAACVIGGTSLAGGKGSVLGSILGALIMATIRNGLSCLGVASAGEKIVLGLILVAAVGFDLALSERRRS